MILLPCQQLDPAAVCPECAGCPSCLGCLCAARFLEAGEVSRESKDADPWGGSPPLLPVHMCTAMHCYRSSVKKTHRPRVRNNYYNLRRKGDNLLSKNDPIQTSSGKDLTHGWIQGGGHCPKKWVIAKVYIFIWCLFLNMTCSLSFQDYLGIFCQMPVPENF